MRRALARLRLPILYAALLAAAFAEYNGLWGNPYYKDDYHWIADARAIGASPAALLRHNPDNKECLVRPVHRLLLASVYRFAGARPGPYFVVGIVLHALAALLVFAFVRRALDPGGTARRSSWIAAGAAFFFLLSRNHTSAVLWIAAHSTLLVTIALLGLSLLVLHRPAHWSDRRAFAVVAAGFLLALYTKSTAAAFPLVYPCLSRRRAPRPHRRLALETASLLALAVLHAVFTKQVLGGVDVAAALSSEGAGAYRLGLNVVRNIASSVVASFVVPQEYHAWLGAGREPYLGAAVVLAAILATLRWVRDRGLVVLALVWIVAMALPTALFDYDQFGDQQITVNRYLYTGMVGVALLFGTWFRAALGERRRRWPVVASLALFAVVAATWTLWQAACVRYQVAWYRTYGLGRTKLVATSLRWVKERTGPGSVLYAVNWKEEDAHIRGMGRLYFEPLGVRLSGMEELRNLEFPLPDGKPRYALRYDDAAMSFGLYPLTNAVERAAVLQAGAAVDSTRAATAGGPPGAPQD